MFLLLLAVVETISCGAGAPEWHLFIVAEVLFQAVCSSLRLWPSKTQNNLSLYFGNQTFPVKLVAMCSSKFFCIVFHSLHARFSYIFIQTNVYLDFGLLRCEPALLQTCILLFGRVFCGIY